MQGVLGQIGESGDSDDWYLITTTASKNQIILETHTPGDGSGQFVNTLAPKIDVFNQSFNIIATGTVGPDGRNESLQTGELVPGEYRVRVRAKNGSKGEYYLSSQLDSIAVLNTVTIDNGTPQRSKVRSITLDFDGDVTSAPSSAFTLVRAEDSLSVPVTASPPTTIGGGQTRVILTFSGPSLDADSLADGHYQLTIHGDQMLDASGHQIDAAANGTLGSTRNVSFHRFFGDGNGDGLVDASDYLPFRTAYLSGDATGANSIYDSNGDGLFSITDLGAFTLRFRMREVPQPHLCRTISQDRSLARR